MSFEDFVPEGLPEDIKLGDDGVDKISVGECGPDVVLDIGHQESKSYQNHDVDVLEHGVVVGVVGGLVVDLGSDEEPVENDDDGLNDQQRNTEYFTVPGVVIHAPIL